jgi:hypothetical protein
MSAGRTILVALIALSLAMLPAASSVAHAKSLEGLISAVPSDCCQHSKPCNHQKTSDGCGSKIGCALKCFNFTGIIVSGAVSKPNAEALARLALPSLGLNSNPTAPPLPPPRV